MGGISIWQLLIIAVIIILLFGTKKLRGVGSDLGSAVKGFKKAISDEDTAKDAKKDDADFTPQNLEKKEAETVEKQKQNDKEQA
ncbi:Sec-independent protein translocase subunit TatA [Aliivibrio wodanis]|uniref:Sec-independent protein translocase protein TatA n=1 Tax=Aliivibrio wodanis TaxID=80852 RepID=A0A090II43_9GAMM|nr:sec-independent protein translocase protein TatA/E homolog [Aliivibrio wodanis]VVV02725.1 Sec-independent protein translocase protein TatA [Aliivibrio wodanis]